MAIALDQPNVISADAGSASGTAISGTTAQPVAADGTVFVAISADGGTAPSGTIGGVTVTFDDSWTTDPKVYLGRAYFPSGLAAGSAYSLPLGTAGTNRVICAASFTGVDGSAPLDVAGTSTSPGLATTYTTSSVAVSAGGLLIGAVNYWASGGSHTPSGSTLEAAELMTVTSDKTIVLVYRIEAAAASYTLTGTFSGAGSQQIAMAPASYKPGAGAGAPAGTVFRREGPRFVRN